MNWIKKRKRKNPVRVIRMKKIVMMKSSILKMRRKPKKKIRRLRILPVGIKNLSPKLL